VPVKLSFPVVLASASPRRTELLRRLIPEFAVIPAHLDEDALTDVDPWVTAQRLAREKCLAVAADHPEALVIGGDTVVAVPDQKCWEQLTKPTDVEDAVRILTRLQNNTHIVITGICLRWPGGMSAFTDESRVTFRSVSESEIRAYIATGEPMDKAGAYGLQGGAKDFIAKVEGSITNVIGLPMEKLEEALRAMR
jgi:septum formation protein